MIIDYNTKIEIIIGGEKVTTWFFIPSNTHSTDGSHGLQSSLFIHIFIYLYTSLFIHIFILISLLRISAYVFTPEIQAKLSATLGTYQQLLQDISRDPKNRILLIKNWQVVINSISDPNLLSRLNKIGSQPKAKCAESRSDIRWHTLISLNSCNIIIADI